MNRSARVLMLALILFSIFLFAAACATKHHSDSGKDDDADDDQDDDFTPVDDDSDDDTDHPLIEGWNAVGDCGRDTIPAASVDSQGHPWIAYATADGDQVNVAYHDGTNWLVSTIDGTFDSVGVERIAMIMDQGDNPHVLFRNNTSLYYAVYSGKGWDVESLTPGSVRGYDISFSNNTPLIVYYSNGGKSLTYAAKPASSWKTFEMDSAASDMSGACTIGADLSDYPVIAYKWGDKIKIITWPGGVVQKETFLTDGTVGGVDHQYDQPQIGTDNTGGLWACYYSYAHDTNDNTYRIGVDCQVRTTGDWQTTAGTPFITEYSEWIRYFPAWMQRTQDSQYLAYSVNGDIRFASRSGADWGIIDPHKSFIGDTNTMGISATDDGTVYIVLNDKGTLSLMMKSPE